MVLHERDGRGVTAEGRSRQQQAAGRSTVGLAEGVAPAERVAAVVHLVEDDQGPRIHRQALVHLGLDRDLGVGDRDAVILPRGRGVTVGEERIEPDADPRGRLGPLGLEVLGGGHDHDAVDHAAAHELGREAERERRLTGAGGRGGEEVAGALADAVGSVGPEVLIERLGLPGAQALRGAPRRALRERRREVLGGEGAEVRLGAVHRAVEGRVGRRPRGGVVGDGCGGVGRIDRGGCRGGGFGERVGGRGDGGVCRGAGTGDRTGARDKARARHRAGTRDSARARHRAGTRDSAGTRDRARARDRAGTRHRTGLATGPGLATGAGLAIRAGLAMRARFSNPSASARIRGAGWGLPPHRTSIPREREHQR